MPQLTDDQILEKFLTEGPGTVTKEEVMDAIDIASEYERERLGPRPQLDKKEPKKEPEEGPIDPRIARIPNEPTRRERSEVRIALREATLADIESTPGVTAEEARRRMDMVDHMMDYYPWGHAPTLSNPPSVERVRELLADDPDDRPAGGPNLREVDTTSVRKIIEAIDSGASDEEVEKLIGEAPIAAWPEEILMTRGLMQAWGRAFGPRVVDLPRTEAAVRVPEQRWAGRREVERKYREMLEDEGIGAAMSAVWAPNAKMSLEEAEQLKLYLPDAPEYDGWATAVSTLSGSGAGILSGSGAVKAISSRLPGGTTTMKQAARAVGSRVLPKLIPAAVTAAEGGTVGATGGPVGIVAGAIIGGVIGWAGGHVYEEMDRGGGDFWKPVPAFGKAAKDDGWYFALPAGMVNLSSRIQVKLGFGTQSLIPIFLSGDDAERFRTEIARSRPTESFEQIVRELQTAKENGMSDKEIRTNLGPTFRGMVSNNAWLDLPPEMRLGNLSTTAMKRWARLNPQAAKDKSRPGLARIVDEINREGGNSISDTTLLNALESVAIGQLPESVYAGSIPAEESWADAVLIAAGVSIGAIETTGGGAAGSRGMEQAMGRLMLRTKEVDGVPQVVEGSVGRIMRVIGAATEFYAEAPIPYITPAGRDFQRSGTTMIRSPDSTYLSRILANIQTGEMGFARHMTDDALARGHERGSMQYDVLGALGLLADWTVYWERPFIASVGVPTGGGIRAYRTNKDLTGAGMKLSERSRFMLAAANSWVFTKTLSADALPVQIAINNLEDLIPGGKVLADVEEAIARTGEGALGRTERKVAQQVRDHMSETGGTYAEALDIVDKKMDADVWTVMRFMMETSLKNAILRGDVDVLDIIPSKWHNNGKVDPGSALHDTLKVAGVDDPMRDVIEHVVSGSRKNGRLHLAGLERLMSEGDPGTQQLRTTPEYIRVKEGIQALVEAGDIEQLHGAWMLGLMEQNAWRMSYDADVPSIKTPVDWFRAVEIRRRGKPPEPPETPDDVGGGPGVAPEPVEVEAPEPLPSSKEIAEELSKPLEEMTGNYKWDSKTGTWKATKRPSVLAPDFDAPLVPSVPRKLEGGIWPATEVRGPEAFHGVPPDMQALGAEIAQQPGRKDIFQALGLNQKDPRFVKRLEAERLGEGRPVGLAWVADDDFLSLRGGTLYVTLQDLTLDIRSSARTAAEADIQVVFADVLEKAVTAQERKIILDDFGERITRGWAQNNQIAPSAMVTIMPGRASEIGSRTHLADDLYGLPTITKSIETEDGYTIVLAEPHPRWAKERVKAEAPPPRVEEIEAPPVEEVPAPRVEEPEAPSTEPKYPLADRGDWYGDADYEARDGHMVSMSPDEYLKRVRPLDPDDPIARENIDDLKSHIQSGRTLDPLAIYADGKEDGRHRAYAAKELGIQRVPVILFGKQAEEVPTPKDKFWVSEKAREPEDVPDKVRSVEVGPTLRERAMDVLSKDLSKMKKAGLIKIIQDLVIIPDKDPKWLQQYTAKELAGAVQRWAELYGRYPILTGKAAPGPIESGAANFQRRMAMSHIDQMSFDGHLSTEGAAILHKVMDRLPSEWFERVDFRGIEDPEVLEDRRVFGQTYLERAADSQLDDAALVQQLKAITTIKTRKATKLKAATAKKMAGLSGDELFSELATMIDETLYRLADEKAFVNNPGFRLDYDTAFMDAATPYFVEIARRLFEDPDVKIRHGWSGMQEMLQDYARQGKIPPNLVSLGTEGSILRVNGRIEAILGSITNEFMGFHDKDVLVFHVLHELSHTLMKNILTDDELSAMRRAFDVHKKAGFEGWHRRDDVAVVKQKSIEPVFNEWAADMLASNLLGHRGFDELMAAIEADEFGDVAHAAKGEVEVIDLEPGVGDLSTQELEAKIESLEDGRAIADWLSENADNPSYRTILKLISPHLDGVSARIYRGKKPAGLAREERIPPDILDETSGTKAVSKVVYDIPKTSKKTGEQVPVDPSKFKAVIWFRSESIKNHGISSETIVHELLHGATQRRLIDASWMPNVENTALGKAYLELEGVRAYVRQEWTRTKVPGWDQSRIEYATSSVDELISFGLTNKGFQEILKGIRTKGNKTAFTRFVELIRDLLGIDAKETNALTDVIRLTEDILGADLEELTIRTATVRSFSQEVRTIFKNLFARIASVLKRTYDDEGIIKSLDIDKDVAEYFTDFVDRLMKEEVEVENIRRIYERRSNESRLLFSISSSKRMVRLRDVSDVEPSTVPQQELEQAVQGAGFIDLSDAKRAMQDAYLSFEEYEHAYAASRQGLGPEEIWDIPVSGQAAVRVNDLRKQWESLTDDIMTRHREGRLDGIEEMEAGANELLSRLQAAMLELQTDRDGVSSGGWASTEESLYRIYQEFLNTREDPEARLQAVDHLRAEEMQGKKVTKKEYDAYFAERIRGIIKSSPVAPGGETMLEMPRLATLKTNALLNRAKKSWQIRSEVKKKNPQAQNFVDEHALAAWNLQRIQVNKLPPDIQAALELTVRDAGGPRGPKRPQAGGPDEPTPSSQFEILFHGAPGEEGGYFSFDPDSYSALVDVLKFGNYKTLVRANALLLSKFMGEKWTQGFVRHFETTRDDAGRFILTERGERQAARSFEYYIRSATSTHGGLKRYLDQAYLTLQDYWAKIRGQVSILPPEVRNFFDRFLRPELRYESDAIKLTQKATRKHPKTFLAETAQERLLAEVQPRKAKQRAFWAVNKDPRVVRAELGIQEGQTHIDPTELLVSAVGYIAAEQSKKLLGPERIFMITPRSMVPEKRRKAVQKRMADRIHTAIGAPFPGWRAIRNKAGDIIIPEAERPTLTAGRRWQDDKMDLGAEVGWHELDPAQQAGMKVLAQDLARHPMGNVVPDRLLVPDADLSTMFQDEWASVIEAVSDIEAGAGAKRAHYSEEIDPSMAYALWNAMKSGVVDLSDSSESVDRLVKNMRRMFKLEEFAGGNLGPVYSQVLQKNIRMMEGAPREILLIVRDALKNEKELTLQQVFVKLKNTLRPPVDPSVVDDIMGTINLEHIDPKMTSKTTGLLEFLREWTGAEKARLYSESTEKSSDFLSGKEQMGPGYHFATGEEGMSKVEYIISNHHMFERVLAASSRYTENQRMNILQPLRRYAMSLEEAKAGGKSGLDWIGELTDDDLVSLGDVFGHIEMALESAHNRITEVGNWIAIAAAGERDAAILLNMTVKEKAAFYKWFYQGDFVKIFDRMLDKGREAGHVVDKFTSYQINQALLNMIVRLRAYELMGDTSRDLARYGLMTDVTELGKDLPLFDAVTKAYTGFRRDAHIDMVQFYIQMHLNYQATELLYQKTVDVLAPDGTPTGETRVTWTSRPPDAPASEEGKSMLSPQRAEYAKRQGWKQDPRIPGNMHEMAAYTEAMEILDRVGVKLSTEAWERVTFHDGTESLMPAGAAREYYDALDRLAEVGTARSGAAPARSFLIGKQGRQALKERPTGVDVEQWGKVLAEGQLGKTIDEMMRLFPMTARHTRMGVTTGIFLPNPAYYIGVGIGAYYQMYEGMGPIGSLRAVATNNEMKMALIARKWREGEYKRYAKPIPTKSGETLTVDMLDMETDLYGMKSGFTYAETQRGVEALMQKEFRVARRGPLGKAMAKVFDQDRLIETSTAIDNYFRLSAYVDARVRGATPHAAAELARKTGLDYAALTEFEKTYMRSTILFYSYFRKNMDLFWDTLLTNPERIIGQMRLVRGIQQIALEEDPEVVLKQYAQTRLPVGFKDAAANQHVLNQWMYIVPPLPYQDAILWPLNFIDSLKGDNEAIRGLVGHVAPWWQAPFVFAQEKDIFWGKELELYNRVPTWLVEWDLNMTGGMLVKDVFDVQLRAHADQSKRDTKGMERWYHARNGKMWWIWRNLMQIPTAGRSMDTISAIDRANLGPVEWMNAKTKELGRGWDPASDRRMRPSDFSEDTMSPRRGLEWYDEFLGLMGIRPMPIEHGFIAGKKIQQRHIADLRKATSRAELSDPYRYEGGILSHTIPGFKPPK